MEKREQSSIRLDQKLWQAIAAHDFNTGPAALTFEGRLARDNGWDAAHTARVCDEYRRFVYLAARAGHQVTPSDAVDQAWHQHLCYTRNYWDVMCTQVLARPLHHGPTLGGAAETDKFTDWYSRTLESYRAHFGAAPPADIWPSPQDRFKGAGQFRRIDTRAHWVIRKPRLPAPVPALAGAGLAPLLLGTPDAVAGNSGGNVRNNEITGLFVFCMVVYALLLRTGNLALGLLFSLFVGGLFLIFYGPAILATPSLIIWGFGVWLLATVVLVRRFYRRKRGGANTSSSSSSGCGGCFTFAGGGGDGGSSGGGGDGGSGCGGGGCGGGCGS
jgi:hypothetical protein